MEIAYFVDIHGEFQVLAAVLRTTRPLDLLIIGGDITTAGTPEEAARAIESWLPLAGRLLAVAENLDSPASWRSWASVSTVAGTRSATSGQKILSRASALAGNHALIEAGQTLSVRLADTQGVEAF